MLINIKNWRIILLISGIIIIFINYIAGLIFPYSWRYVKCPPLSCDIYPQFGYETNYLYFFITLIALLFIILGTIFILGELIFKKFLKH